VLQFLAVAISAASGTTPATPTVAASATATSAFAGCHGPGFVHHQRATQQFPAVARFNRMIGLCIVGDFHESKPTRFPLKRSRMTLTLSTVTPACPKKVSRSVSVAE
jgi:hypothetical protein